MSIPSAYLAIFVAIFAMCVGTAALALQKKVFNYINDNGTDLGLSSKQIDLFKNWYAVTAYVMFGLCVLELLRYMASARYREVQLRMDGEFDALLLEDEKKWNEKIYVNKVGREEKYNDLRAYYKAKYGIGQNKDTSQKDPSHYSQF